MKLLPLFRPPLSFKASQFSATLGISLLLLSSASFAGSVSASEFLPGGVSRANLGTELRAQCVQQDSPGQCSLAHLWIVDPQAERRQLTAFPIAWESLSQLKIQGHAANALSDQGYSNTEMLEGIQWVWAPFMVTLDAIGYAIGTPAFLTFKLIGNVKWNKLLKALQGDQVVRMGFASFDTVTDVICKQGRIARERAVLVENGYPAHMRTHHVRNFRDLMEPYSPCGVAR